MEFPEEVAKLLEVVNLHGLRREDNFLLMEYVVCLHVTDKCFEILAEVP
jgi:hypothetical protein